MNFKYFAAIQVLLMHQVVTSNSVSKAVNQFVSRIDQILTHHNELNSVLCPFNLHLGLSLLEQGAGGDTATELASVLGLTDDKVEVANSYKTLLEKLTGESFKTWTCMIPGEKFDLQTDFVSTAYRYFKTGAAGASQTHNGTKTDVMLKYCNSIGSRPKTTKLQMFCKAGLNATWRKPFPSTEERDFMVSSGGKVKMMMMTLNDVLACKEDSSLGAKILRLDYSEEGWFMVLVIPNSNEGLSSLQAKIAARPLTDLIKDLKEVKLEVVIPKFNANAFNFHRDMKFLEKMGGQRLFSKKADFNGVSAGGGVHLSHVLIEAFLYVNETGTLAGSGADFLAGGGDELPQKTRSPQAPPPGTTPVSPAALGVQHSTPSFNADRPFLFYVVGPTDVFLYSGKFVGPKKQTS